MSHCKNRKIVQTFLVCSLIAFAGSLPSRANEPLPKGNAIRPPPNQENEKPLCGQKQDRYKNAGGFDYRDNQLARYLRDRKIAEQQPKADMGQPVDQTAPQPDDQLPVNGTSQPASLISTFFCNGIYLSSILNTERIKVPVLLGEFPDKPLTNSYSHFDNMLFNSSNPWNMTEYFKDVSYGKLELTGDIFGPYGVDQDYSDYDYTSYSDARDVVEELVEKADPYVDFSHYDADGNGYVDAVIVAASGYIGPGGAHQGNINYLTDDGVYVTSYTYQQGNSIGTYGNVGTYCHEMCHVFGLPDLYGDNAAGEWDIMSGSIDDPPAHLSAWSKAELGWLNPTLIREPTNNQIVRNAEEHPTAYKISVAGLPLEEYFLIENRQQIGFDSSLPGAGLIIWRVGSDLVMEQADGLYELNGAGTSDSGDPWPGSTDNTEFTGSTTPNSDFEDGAESGIEITDITDGDVITADFYTPEHMSFWRGLDSGSSASFQDVNFVDEEIGWVVGSAGTVLHTDDGGATWTKQSSGSTGYLYSVQFVDENTGWCVGQYGMILNTTNAGINWTSQTSTVSSTLYGVSFGDSTHGYCYGNDLVLRTSDAGATWEEIETGYEDDEYYEDIKFIDANEGYILCESSALLHTTDGGDTWTSTILYDEDEDGVGDATVFSLYADSDQLWAVGEDGWIIYSDSNDTVAFHDPDYSGNIDIDLVGNEGAIVGQHILMFNPSGSECDGADCSDGTWEAEADLEFDNTPDAVDFASSDIGYAVGSDGLILKYEVDYEAAERCDNGWALNVSGVESAGRSIDSDDSGNIYVTGQFAHDPEFDPLGSGKKLASWNNTKDGFVAKYNCFGELLWANQFGGTNETDLGRAITVDNDGNVYIAGCFQNSASFYWLLWVPVGLISSGAEDIFIAKLDPDGNYVWLRRVGGSGSDWAKDIAVDDEGNVYVTGYFKNTVDFNPSSSSTYNLTSAGGTDGFVLKLNSSGNFNWARRIGGQANEVGFGIAVDDSKVYVCGYHESNPCYVGSYSSGTSVYVNNWGDTDCFVVSYSQSSGYVQWARYYGGDEEDKAFDLALDDYSYIYVTGHFNDSAKFSSETLVAGGIASDTFVCKLDEFGSMIWAESNEQSGSGTDANGSSTGRGIAVTENGCNVYVTGQFQGTVDFDPSSERAWINGPVCSYGTCNDVFLWNLTGDGKYGWTSVGGSGADGDDMGYGVAVNAEGDIVTTGYFQEEIGWFSDEELVSSSGTGFQDIFIWKK